MNVVFGRCSSFLGQSLSHLTVPGRLVGAFGAFYNPESGETKEMFTKTIDKNVYDLSFDVYKILELNRNLGYTWCTYSPEDFFSIMLQWYVAHAILHSRKTGTN
jgi:hypothetical protein